MILAGPVRLAHTSCVSGSASRPISRAEEQRLYDRALEEHQAGRTDVAAVMLRLFIRRATATGSRWVVARAKCTLGGILVGTDEGLGLLQEALGEQLHGGPREDRVEAYLSMVNALWERDQLIAALRCAFAAEDLVADSDPLAADVQLLLGELAASLGAHTEAIDCFRKAIRLVQRSPNDRATDTQILCQAHAAMGVTLLMEGERRQGLAALQERLELARRLEPEEQADAHRDIAHALRDSDPALARAHLEGALALLVREPSELRSDVRRDLADLCRDAEEWAPAQRTLLAAEADLVAVGLAGSEGHGHLLTDLGLIELELGEWGDARRNLTRAGEMLAGVDSASLRWLLAFHLGVAILLDGDAAAALPGLREARALATSLHQEDWASQVQVYLDQAEAGAGSSGPAAPLPEWVRGLHLGEGDEPPRRPRRRPSWRR